ncbi:hypothetical protein [Albirhodobacter sp. R86504]|uniref:hypothetical protein n=1 Tax=Albirhodobacter sp. R86504 TaxID=3093848 RepID=UPI00366B59C3
MTPASNDQIQPETAARLDGLVAEFSDQSQAYYQRVFTYMMQAPGYRFTLNPAAALLGAVWFGARGLWSWFLTVLVFETFAFIQIGMGLFGDLGRDARLRADQIAQTLDLRMQQIEAAKASAAPSLAALEGAASDGAGTSAHRRARGGRCGGCRRHGPSRDRAFAACGCAVRRRRFGELDVGGAVRPLAI